MLLGLINDPSQPLERELARIAGLGFELVDLTLEPQGARPVDAAEVRRRLDENVLEAVGHTAPALRVGNVDRPAAVRGGCARPATTGR